MTNEQFGDPSQAAVAHQEQQVEEASPAAGSQQPQPEMTLLQQQEKADEARERAKQVQTEASAQQQEQEKQLQIQRVQQEFADLRPGVEAADGGENPFKIQWLQMIIDSGEVTSSERMKELVALPPDQLAEQEEYRLVQKKMDQALFDAAQQRQANNPDGSFDFSQLSREDIAELRDKGVGEVVSILVDKESEKTGDTDKNKIKEWVWRQIARVYMVTAEPISKITASSNFGRLIDALFKDMESVGMNWDQARNNPNAETIHFSQLMDLLKNKQKTVETFFYINEELRKSVPMSDYAFLKTKDISKEELNEVKPEQLQEFLIEVMSMIKVDDERGRAAKKALETGLNKSLYDGVSRDGKILDARFFRHIEELASATPTYNQWAEQLSKN